MSIQMVCPNMRCKHMHSFPDEARGQVIKCLRCDTKFRIPSPRLPAPKPGRGAKPSDFIKVPAAPFVF
jgi:hypothetical protein